MISSTFQVKIVVLKMENLLKFLRFFSVFPRHLSKSRKTGQLKIGRISMGFFCMSLSFLILRGTLMVDDLSFSYYYNAIFKKHRVFTLFLWNFSWVFTEAVAIITLILKHRKFRHLLQTLFNFQPFVNPATLTKNHKTVMILRLARFFISFCLEIMTFITYFNIWMTLTLMINRITSFAFLFLFQICTFSVTNNLSRILEMLVQGDGCTVCEKRDVQLVSKNLDQQNPKTFLMRIRDRASASDRTPEEGIKLTLMLLKIVEEMTALVTDVFGIPLLVLLFHCLVGLIFSSSNTINAVFEQPPLEVLGYFCYIIESAVTAWGFADLCYTMNEEVYILIGCIHYKKW